MVLLAAVLAIVGLKVLIARNWLAGFIRGFAGFTLIGLAVVIILSSINLATYQKLGQQQTYVQIHFKQLADQHYKVSVTNAANGAIVEAEMHGDTWQLEANRIRLISKNKAYYQVQSLSARYYALEQDNHAGRQEISLNTQVAGLDLARWLKSYKKGSWTASQWRTHYSPMVDGASYSVVVTATGFEVKAINEAAQVALSQWL